VSDPSPAGPLLVELEVADPPEAWAAAGFAVEGGRCTIGAVRIRLVGRDDDGGARRGIVGWSIANIDLGGATGELDGLPTKAAAHDAASEPQGEPHPNGTVGLDHVVVLTPDLDRTIAACEAAGLELRRIREGAGGDGAQVRQAFFRLGSTILEVVSAPGPGSGEPASTAPARWFGLAVDVDDLDETHALLGDALGRIKPAVQEGRRIATLRHRDLGMSVSVAAMDRHGDR
jgi:catechol 2,3-dioxygenase-like lactoylglutathione lyase family enzyme